MENKLVIGKVLSSHGVRGEMKVQSLSGEDRHFRSIDKAWLRSRSRETAFAVKSVRGALPNLIIALEGIDSIEDARKFRGCEFLVDRKHALPLEDNEYYIADLIGCEVFFKENQMGTVVSVWENSNCDMLEVKLGEDRIAQLPLQDQFVSDVDTDAKRIVLRVDWILE